MDSKWRDLTDTEQAILRKLLDADFPRVEVLRQQLSGLQAREIEGERSIELKVQVQVRAATARAVPVEAAYCETGVFDALGSEPQVHVLLHVVNGLISELEFYRDDGLPIQRLPSASELHIFTPVEGQ